MSNSIFKYKGVNYVVPFCLVTACFALWGFANDITQPMVKLFSRIFRMSVTEGTLVQVAFYCGYFAMAVPAALFIRRFSYKAGILMGLALYAVGALLFFPAQQIGNFYPFLVAYFILTCGLSFLETSANPFILAMGAPETATRRLNLAQAFNPLGALCGILVAQRYIQPGVNPMTSEERALLDPEQFDAVKSADLAVLIRPYLGIAVVIAVMFVLLAFMRIPTREEAVSSATERAQSGSARDSIRRLMHNRRYSLGLVAQFFYVGVQTMCWTFITHYGTHYFVSEGLTESAAEQQAMQFFLYSMIVFFVSRFVCTFLLKFFNAGGLLTVLSVFAACCTLGAIFLHNVWGLYCLVGVSAGMSLMFPTIYGIALEGVQQDSKFGAAGLIMSIVGGSVLTPVQAAIMDTGSNGSMIHASFVVPLVCFVVIAGYGVLTYRKKI
jgi:FHS family L-fucose permease-like MFS transporter